MNRTEVLIVGAGPTGLVLALWLARQGVNLRIIDKTAGPSTTSRALAVQARTLELYRQLDLADEVLRQGHRVAAINLWVKGRKAARIPFDTIAEGRTPYSPLVFPQDRHERLLIARLQAMGIAVERETELLGLDDTGEQVIATLRLPDASRQDCETQYLAGCDGARSIVRQAIGTGFPGGTYQQVFYVADVQARGPAINGELNIDLDVADFLAVFPLKDEGRARLIGTLRESPGARPENLKFEDVSGRAIEHMKVDIAQVHWFSTYRVHHRVTDHFRKGRCFLLGDAAHIHSPAGGQGMNTRIGDAINLAWKLKAVLAGQASDALLQTYETERRAFAQALVATTDRGFTLATAQGRLARFVRTRIVPHVMPALFRLESARGYIYRAVSQIGIAYRDSAISAGRAGKIRGGDRLPWARTPISDNFGTLGAIAWQLHVYGTAQTGLAAWCESHGLALHVFEWQPNHEKAGLARDAMYLLRPDTYVALAGSSQDPQVLEQYFARHGLTLAA